MAMMGQNFERQVSISKFAHSTATFYDLNNTLKHMKTCHSFKSKQNEFLINNKSVRRYDLGLYTLRGNPTNTKHEIYGS